MKYLSVFATKTMARYLYHLYFATPAASIIALPKIGVQVKSSDQVPHLSKNATPQIGRAHV